MASQQSGLSASEEIPVEGSLSYWTTVVNKWQNRWCVLKEDGYLYYYAVSVCIILFRYLKTNDLLSFAFCMRNIAHNIIAIQGLSMYLFI